MSKKKLSTSLVQSGLGKDRAYSAVVPPLYTSSTFEMDGLSAEMEYSYSRSANPTRDLLAKAMAEIEEGSDCAVTASGMAALTICLHLLDKDDLLLAPFDCYGRSYRTLVTMADKGYFKLEFVDQYSNQSLEKAFEANPKMVLVETPSNPVMRIADIQKISHMAKACGALVVCDNTFLSPVFQRPLELGADISYCSTTKFVNGHSDVVGGAVVAKDQKIADELHFWNNSLGTIGSPFDAYQTLRGLRTLDVRMQRAQENAIKIAAFLDAHNAVSKVYYPGLSSHEGFALAERQQDGPGAMLSFEITSDVHMFLERLEIFRLAQSLGGTESLINNPASMTHVSMGAEARAQAGVKDGLMRLSVGIEHCDDLIADLEQALKKA